VERINRWLTFTANAGVVAGLVLVAYEINQTQRQLEVAALADSTDNFTQAMETLSQDRDFSELIFRAETNFDELDELERWRVYKYLDGFMTMSEQDFHVLKNIEEGTLGGFEYDWKHFMKQPHYRAYWLANENRFGIEFRAFVNGLLANEGRLP
jgi:hypothetical protein